MEVDENQGKEEGEDQGQDSNTKDQQSPAAKGEEDVDNETVSMDKDN